MFFSNCCSIETIVPSRSPNESEGGMEFTGMSESDDAAMTLARRHFTIGWIMCSIFIAMGLALEVFHGFKIQWYVDLSNQTRRLMWTLSHAHGVLIGLLHFAFAANAWMTPRAMRRSALASVCLTIAGILLPGGFFLGGLVIHQGDPGIGVFLTPAGGASLLAAALITAWDMLQHKRQSLRSS